MSEREKTQNEVVEFLQSGNFNAPYGILAGIQKDKKNQEYRSVTFGMARTLDAEVRIYGPKFLLLRWNHGTLEKFDSVDSLKAFILETWGYCFEPKGSDGMIEFCRLNKSCG